MSSLIIFLGLGAVVWAAIRGAEKASGHKILGRGYGRKPRP